MLDIGNDSNDNDDYIISQLKEELEVLTNTNNDIPSNPTVKKKQMTKYKTSRNLQPKKKITCKDNLIERPKQITKYKSIRKYLINQKSTLSLSQYQNHYYPHWYLLKDINQHLNLCLHPPLHQISNYLFPYQKHSTLLFLLSISILLITH